MNKLYIPQRLHSLARLNYVAKSMVILVWGLGLTYFLSEIYIWFSHSPEMIKAILTSFSDMEPTLAHPDFQLSRSVTVLLYIYDMLPVGVTSLVLLLVGFFS